MFAIKDNRGRLPSGKESAGDERIELPSGILVIDTIDTIVTSYLTRQDICELLRLIYDKDTEMTERGRKPRGIRITRGTRRPTKRYSDNTRPLRIAYIFEALYLFTASN